ncbi:MAG: hypothetical protein B7Z78_11795 [Rhodospirillales bacterium 20-60-12]|nr:MAG: hypothetical protein B7Z78_11795 [Rhodospirillales bacterium 20-60-12]
MTKKLTPGQTEYERQRAAKAGKTLDAWMREKAAREEAAKKIPVKAAPPKKKGLIGRLLDKAHKPI